MNNFSTDSSKTEIRETRPFLKRVRFSTLPDDVIEQSESTPSIDASLDSIAFSLQRIAEALDALAGVNTND